MLTDNGNIGEMQLNTSVPVMLLGGAANGVAVARNLSRLGITVRASGMQGCLALESRHCTQGFRIPLSVRQADGWRDLLLGDSAGALRGSVIFALCDEAIDFVSRHKSELTKNYVLEDFDPDLRLEMLDKLATLHRAKSAGIQTPNFWTVKTVDDLENLRAEIEFPVLVKPVHSHMFVPVFGRKLFIVESGWDELIEKVRAAHDHQLEVMVVEMIPGPDSLLSSYYTYIDSNCNSLFHFTKSVIRRYPTNRGGACYHKSEWLPETAEAGRAFFASMPWRGMANIEFKRDPRDGKLKIIEVNPRFTDAHCMVVGCGMPIDEMIYRRLTGQHVPQISEYEEDVRMWVPLRDMLAFAELHRKGSLTFGQWIRSLRQGRKVLPLFNIRDPRPSFVRLTDEVGRLLSRV